MHKWKVSVYTRYHWSRSTIVDAQMQHCGFTPLEIVGTHFSLDGVDTACYTTTHKSRSAMMMYSLKYPHDDDVEIEEYSDA
jgi:hypothetical protein